MSCQICNFVNNTQLTVIPSTTTAEILAGKARLPFTTRAAWLSIQSECPDLRRTHAHLRQGTRYSRKTINIKHFKHYLYVSIIAKDCLLVVKRNGLLLPTREGLVVPRQMLDGLLTTLHIQLYHPSVLQLKVEQHVATHSVIRIRKGQGDRTYHQRISPPRFPSHLSTQRSWTIHHRPSRWCQSRCVI